MPKSTSIVGASGGIDTSDLQAFIRALRKASPQAAAGLRRNMRVAGRIVEAEAKAIAGQHSKTIPPTIHTTVYGASVAVKAGKDVPLAALYELGNKPGGGRKNSETTFSHPVFERSSTGQLQPTDQWQEQPRFPFLKPAADAKGLELEAEVLKVADDVARTITGWGI